MEKLITGSQIVKSYGEGAEKNTVLNGVSISIAPGEFAAIMGPSGSGKTTLMYALSGMDTIDSGEVSYEDTLLTGLSEDKLADLRRQKMGFIFQQATLLKNLSLLDNIILPALRKRAANKTADKTNDKANSKTALADKAKKLMESMGIGGLEKRGITQTSGGQLQRAGICRALINDPEVIFCDEPTGALNSKAAAGIMALLAEVNKGGTTIVLVTHDARVAAQAGRVLFMRDGTLVSELSLAGYASDDLDGRQAAVTEKMHEIEI
jgi:putative ABC transport system ATP-binding protein